MKQALSLIAHRGYSGSYPENTLIAYQAAYDSGARFIELDLQLSSDLVPVLHHDLSLKRMADVERNICETTAKQLTQYKANYPTAFGNRFLNNTLTTFKQFCQWLQKYSDVTAFIEIKPESIDYFGQAAVANAIYREIDASHTQSQVIIISSHINIIEDMRRLYSLQIGWVLPALDDKTNHDLEALKPDFAFCDIDFLPKNDQTLRPGSWKWAIYNADDVSTATALANRGIEFIETNEIGTLIQAEGLANLL